MILATVGSFPLDHHVWSDAGDADRRWELAVFDGWQRVAKVGKRTKNHFEDFLPPSHTNSATSTWPTLVVIDLDVRPHDTSSMCNDRKIVCIRQRVRQQLLLHPLL